MKKYVAYYRLSVDPNKGKTKDRLRELGIEAQQDIVRHYYGNDLEKEFYDVGKSGKDVTSRPVLQEAIRFCIDNGCILVVAKLDRLSRNVDDCRAILNQLNSNLRSCDIPGEIDKFVLTLFAAFAERERELISLRTSQALQAKAKTEGWWQKPSDGIKDGSYSKKAGETHKRKAVENGNSIRAAEVIMMKVKEGMNFNQIAHYLNIKQFLTPRGKEFTQIQVERIYERHCVKE